jgi:hypothetical protein
VINKKSRARNSKWKDEFLISVTHMARDGLTESQMAKMMGISKITFTQWEDKNPLFKKAVEAGRAYTKRGRRGMSELSDYIYRKLSPKSKKLWRKINMLNVDKTKDRKKIDNLLAGQGRRMRQRMFLCAWTNNLCSIAAACRKIGINRNTFELWKRDTYFQKMIWEVEEAIKDVFEGCVVRNAVAGDSVILSKIMDTKLKDRGYAKENKIDVNVQGQITHTHEVVAVDDLKLPFRIRKQLLAAVRERKKIVESTVVDTQKSKAVV